MTHEQQSEWDYRVDERLGILTDGRREPDFADLNIAINEANEWLKQHENQTSDPGAGARTAVECGNAILGGVQRPQGELGIDDYRWKR